MLKKGALLLEPIRLGIALAESMAQAVERGVAVPALPHQHLNGCAETYVELAHLMLMASCANREAGGCAFGPNVDDLPTACLLPESLRLEVDDWLAHVEAAEATDAVLVQGYAQLSAKDARQRNGLYYTPPEAARYLVRTADAFLRDKLGFRKGAADERLAVLDVATGPGVFLMEWARFCGKNAPLLLGLEQDPAACHLAELNLRRVAAETGATLRSRLWTVNPLVEEAPWLDELAALLDGRFLVVVGNPPWRGRSAWNDGWVGKLIQDYKYVDGAHFGERKHWLQDDYVKFIRLAQWLIEQQGCGLCALYTNHSFLDNLTYRGMRQHLMGTFDQLYCLDLHGNAQRRERQPDGRRDGNIFDVAQGACLTFGLKQAGLKRGVHSADLFGDKIEKPAFLAQGKPPAWTPVQPEAPYYFFKNTGPVGAAHLPDGFSVRDMFNVQGSGMVTARDRFVVDFDANPLLQRIRSLAGGPFRQLAEVYNLHDTTTFDLEGARRILKAEPDLRAYLQPVHYRPFDVRTIFYHPAVVERPLLNSMRHLLQPNVGLVFQRGCRSGATMNLPQVTSMLIDHGVSYPGNTAVSFVAPLYYYDEQGVASPNFKDGFIRFWEQRFGADPDARQLLAVVYGQCYCPTFRSKYADLLCADYPQYRFTPELVAALEAPGRALIDLHLSGLRLQEGEPSAKYSGRSRPLVEKVSLSNNAVYLNEKDRFGPISAELWAMEIGGYPVLRKYLKSRRGRKLTASEITQVRHIIDILTKTQRLMQDIEQAAGALV